MLEHYSIPFLDQMVAMVTAATVMSYAIYAVNSPLIGSKMLATLPPVLYGIFRYLYLIYDRKDTRSTDAILLEDYGMIGAGGHLGRERDHPARDLPLTVLRPSSAGSRRACARARSGPCGAPDVQIKPCSDLAPVLEYSVAIRFAFAQATFDGADASAAVLHPRPRRRCRAPRAAGRRPRPEAG